jgi:hypothetical protein
MAERFVPPTIERHLELRRKEPGPEIPKNGRHGRLPDSHSRPRSSLDIDAEHPVELGHPGQRCGALIVLRPRGGAALGHDETAVVGVEGEYTSLSHAVDPWSRHQGGREGR